MYKLSLPRKMSRTGERTSLKHQIGPVLILNPDWAVEERRGVDFFLHTTVLKFITLQRDRVFWKEIVPCLFETHELLFDKDADRLNVFALKQCNKATEVLQSSLSDFGSSFLLVSCILVSVYNLLRGDFVSADMSIECGLRMVTRTTYDEFPSNVDPF